MPTAKEFLESWQPKSADEPLSATGFLARYQPQQEDLPGRNVNPAYDNLLAGLSQAPVPEFGIERKAPPVEEATDDDGLITAVTKGFQNTPTRFQAVFGGLLQAVGEQGERQKIAAQAGEDYLNADNLTDRANALGTLLKNRPGLLAGTPLGDLLAKKGKEIGKKAAKDLKENAFKGERGIPYYVNAAIEGLGTMAPAVVTGLITRSPKVGAAVMGSQVFGEKYSQQRADGRSETEAAADATFYALSEAIPEKFALDQFLRAGRSLVKRIFAGALSESGQEVVTEALNIGYETGVLDKNISVKDSLLRLMDAGILGFLTGTVVAGVTHPFVSGKSTQPNTRGNNTSTNSEDDTSINAEDLLGEEAQDTSAQAPENSAPIGPRNTAQNEVEDALTRLSAQGAPQAQQEAASLRPDTQEAAEKLRPQGQETEGPLKQQTLETTPDKQLQNLQATLTTIGLPAEDVNQQIAEAGKLGLIDKAKQSGAPQTPTEPTTETSAQDTPTKIAAQGKTTKIHTAAGNPLEVRYALANVDDLIASHDDKGNINPAFPTQLQPRDRSRAGYQGQIAKMAGSLNPQMLGESPKAADGAPIVGPDGVVESGNGRVAAIGRHYRQGGQDYKRWLTDNAERFGLDPERINATDRPVLVRQRQTPMDDTQRAQFAREANRPDLSQMSPAETARADASQLTQAMLDKYNPSEDGNVLSQGNADFLRDFSQAIGQEEAAGLTNAKGGYTKQMADRVQAAVFQSAYGNDRLLELFAEEADPGIKNILSALNVAAPSFARAKASNQGAEGLDLVTPLVGAIDALRSAKEAGISVADAISQQDAFTEIDPIADKLALFLDANKRSAKRMGEWLTHMAGDIEAELISRQNEPLFENAPITSESIVDEAHQRFTPQTQDTLFRPGNVQPHDAQSGEQSQPTGRGRAETQDTRATKTPVEQPIEQATPEAHPRQAALKRKSQRKRKAKPQTPLETPEPSGVSDSGGRGLVAVQEDGSGKKESGASSSLSAQDLLQEMAAFMRHEIQWRFDKEGESYQITTADGDPIGVVASKPRSGSELTALMGPVLANKIRKAGIVLPRNPEDMSLDEFTLAYEGGIIPSFEITGDEIGSVLKTTGPMGTFQVDIRELYHKIQAQKAARAKEEKPKERSANQANRRETPKVKKPTADDESPRFSKKAPEPSPKKTKTAKTQGISKSSLIKHAATLMRAWKNRPPVEVVSRFDELPEAIQKKALEASSGSDIEGVYWKGSVYLVAENIQSLQRAETVILHEVRGHYGLRGMLGNKLTPLLNQVYLAYGKSGLKDIAKRYKLDLNTLEGRLTAAEEQFAHMAQTGERPGLLKKLYGLLRDWLRKMGFSLKLNDTDMALLIERSARFVEGGRAPSRVSGQRAELAFQRRVGKLDDFSRVNAVRNALKEIVSGKNEAVVRNLRPDLAQYGGDSDVYFQWGNAKSGLMHIGKKRGAGVILKVAEAVAIGNKVQHIPGKKTVRITHNGVTAVLSLDEHGKQKTWLLTGWEEGRPDARGEVSTHSTATQSIPIFSRDELGAGLNSILGTSDIKSSSKNNEDEDIRFSRRVEEIQEDIEREATASRPRLLKRAKRAIQRVHKHLEFIEPIKNLPGKKEYLKQRYLALGKVARVDEGVRKIYDAFRNAGPEDAPKIFEYLTHKDAPAEIIQNENARRNAVEVKRAFVRIGERLVEKGLLDRETFEANKGAYLPRLYLKHLLDEDSFLALGSGKTPSSMGYLKGRKDIPESVRQLILGEIKDPAFLAAKGFGQQMRDIALLDWMEEIAKNQDWVLQQSLVDWEGRKVTPYYLKSEANRIRQQSLYYEAERRRAARDIADRMEDAANTGLESVEGVPDNFKRVPNIPRYGALRGMIVHKEIYDDIIGSVKISTGDESLPERILGDGGLATKFTQLWKWSKVAANPPAQIRNFIGNGIMLHLSGVDFHKVPIRMSQAIKEIRNNGTHYQIAKKYGVTESTFTAQELKRVEREFLDYQARMSGNFSLSGLKRLGGKIMDKTGDLYQLSETVFKTAKIIDEMKKGRSESDAALEAQKWLFDYSLVTPGARYLRNAPIGVPFLSFYFKSLPRLAEVATHHPMKYLPYLAAPTALVSLMAHMEDVDDEDVEALTEALPDWLRKRGNAYILPAKDDQGRWVAMDFGYFLPWAAWTELLNHTAKGGFSDAMMASGLLGGPIPDMIAAIKTNKDPFTQKEIINKSDPPARQIASLMGYLYNLSMPSWLTDHGFAGHMMRALDGSVDKYGEPKSNPLQAALRLVGVNLYPINPELSRANNLRWMDFEIKDIKKRGMALTRDPNLTTKQRQDIRDEYGEFIRKRMEQRKAYAERSRVHPNLR